MLEASLAQLPVDPGRNEVIVRTDSGGTRTGWPTPARERHVRFIGGVPACAAFAKVVRHLAKNRWKKAISSDGTEELETGQVAEVTDLVDLSAWPEGTRMIARREQPHPGAQLRFTDIEGYRYQVFVTDLADPDICYLEALYRGRGRVECAIRDAKDTGLANLPSHSFAINAAWLAVVLIASDLLAWMKGLCLEGELARAEPKRLRYTLLHSAGILVSSARRPSVRIAAGWPWADELVGAFGRLPGWASTSPEITQRTPIPPRPTASTSTSANGCTRTPQQGSSPSAAKPPTLIVTLPMLDRASPAAY